MVQYSIYCCVLINCVFGNIEGGKEELLGKAVKAYRETSAIKSLSSVCVNMSWPDDFISRYLFVSWSTPPIINRPPCIFETCWMCVACEGVCE